MINRYLFLFLSIGIIMIVSFQTSGHITQSQAMVGHDTLFWSESTILTWSDFKGDIPEDKEWAGAELHSNFYPELIDFSDKYVRVKIAAYCLRDLSWVRKDTKLEDEDGYSIKHELFHFHITEVCARKFRKELIESIGWKPENFEKYFKSIAIRHYNYLAQMHTLYDKETINSLDSDVQRYWENNIIDSLKMYSGYSEPDLLILYGN